jgi:hypothetical protein
MPPDSIDPGSASSGGDITWEKKTLFSFGTVLFLILLVIALFDRKPTQTSWYVYTCILAMAAGGIAAVLPGAVAVKLPVGIRASGALAIAALVFYFGFRLGEPPAVQDLNAYLVPVPETCSSPETASSPAIPPPNPKHSEVYVLLNSKVVVHDDAAGTPVGSPNISVTRSLIGGVQIGFKALPRGSTVLVAQRDNQHWWTSGDIVVPQMSFQMEQDDEVANRIDHGK